MAIGSSLVFFQLQLEQYSTLQLVLWAQVGGQLFRLGLEVLHRCGPVLDWTG